MNTSLFPQYVNALWPQLNLYIQEKTNGTDKALTYLHKQMLTKVYTPDQKWESASVDHTYVAADMVALDSPLPLKARDRVASASGILPKVGIKRILNEQQINNINIMLNAISANGANAAQKKQVLKKILADVDACAVGIDERNEANYLSAISNGCVLVEDGKNTGIGLRVDYGYLPDHVIATATAGTIAYDDIKAVFTAAEANGDSITAIMVDLGTYNAMRNSRWAKELVADYRGIPHTSNTNLPVPPSNAFDEAFADDNKGVKFIKVDRTVKYEKNGVRQSYKPFNVDRLVFLVHSDKVGSLVWGTLAEVTNPVQGVNYQTVDEYKLISRYSYNDPLREVTSGQALVLPVIENVDQIYVLDKSTPAASGDDEEEEGAGVL